MNEQDNRNSKGQLSDSEPSHTPAGPQPKIPDWKLPAAIAMAFLWITTVFFLWLPGQIEPPAQEEAADWSVQTYTRENPIREGDHVTLQVFVYDNETKDPVKDAEVTADLHLREEGLTFHYVENGLYETTDQVIENVILSGTVLVKRENLSASAGFEFPVEPFEDRWEETRTAFLITEPEAVSQ
ncbi:hypothetical protein CR205_10725 [Alteribacter lacisalsi]|uniref:Uncharacterized protein n=1 Tax=Alteribacter lacisalsi TaxID=2045244 RepID=A0A2W0HQ71_9BACI|nr:hypothetical protein [Alteribacter lacisalsi]PYZ99009.1 hypothetical protein CR205_10725 [Alteribacter lacisalsi]